MNNAQIAATLEQLADLLEFRGENPFRVRAYRNAARVVHDLGEPIAAVLTQPGRQLTDFAGIGKDLAEKITTLIATGKLPQLEQLLQEIPASVLTMVRIPGLGPKKAAAIFKELHVTTLDELRKACQQHKIRELKGFAAKTEETILAGIELAASADVRMYWADADVIAQALLAHLRPCPKSCRPRLRAAIAADATRSATWTCWWPVRTRRR